MQIARLTHPPSGLVFAILMVLTCLTYLLFEGELLGRWSPVIIVLIAMIKSRMVILHFMEASNAPRPWRFLYETWNLAVPAIIIAGYLVGTK